MLRRLGPFFVVFVACVWLNQSFGLITWEKVRYDVFTDPAAHVFDTLRYPFLFLYRRSPDEAMYYGAAAQMLGRPYDHDVVALHSRGRVTEAPSFEAPPPPTDGRWHVPWAEVHLEYPAPVLPFVVAPKLLTETFEGYARSFGLLMGLCIVASMAVAIDLLRGADETRPSPDVRWGLGVALLLAQGALTIQRLDPIVAFTMIAAVRGAVRRSPRSLGVWAGLAGACKVVPILLVPVVVACEWSFWRPRILRLAAWTAGGLAVGFVPMLLASPRAFVEFFRYHSARGLQVESTLGALVGAARLGLGTSRPGTISYGSFNVEGDVADVLAKLGLPLTLAGIGVLAVLEVRAIREACANDTAEAPEIQRLERIGCAAVAATVVVWLAGKVFSPQYLTWIIPLVLVIPGRRGVVATWIVILACTLTQVYYRGFYDLVFDQRLIGVLAVLVRQGVLLALLLWVMPSAMPRAPWRGRAVPDTLAT